MRKEVVNFVNNEVKKNIERVKANGEHLVGTKISDELFWSAYDVVDLLEAEGYKATVDYDTIWVRC